MTMAETQRAGSIVQARTAAQPVSTPSRICFNIGQAPADDRVAGQCQNGGER
jgi:hypothetical protein